MSDPNSQQSPQPICFFYVNATIVQDLFIVKIETVRT